MEEIVRALPETQHYVVIDEIQKIPKLLDAVHFLIETTNKKFILKEEVCAEKIRKGFSAF